MREWLIAGVITVALVTVVTVGIVAVGNRYGWWVV